VSAERALAQAPPARAGQAFAVASGHDAAEREAEHAGEDAARGTLLTGWSFASVPVSAPAGAAPEADIHAARAVAGPGRPLDPATRNAMEARLAVDLSPVRLHDDAATAAATRAAGAEALAVGDDVALATGRHDPASPRSRALLAHELTHVAQQRSAGPVRLVQRNNGAPAVPVTTLEGLPEADRKQIQLVTTKVTVPDLAGKFATTGTKTTLPLPGGVTAAFDASVDPALQAGLSNVAGSLSTTVELTPAPLPPNSTVTLELDPGGTTGKGLYRFTYHVPSAPAGAKGPAPAQRILVEALGKATAPAGTKAPAAPAAGAAPTPDPVAEKITKHSISQSYSGAELDALRAALDQVPDSHLAVVSGLKFTRAPKHPTDPRAAGDYDPKKHTVTMFDLAFTGAQNRVKGAGTVASDPATRAIVHEIGHAVDLAAMRNAGVEKDKADAAVAGLPKQFPDPDDPKGYRYENPDQKKQIDAVLKAQADAEAGLVKARSLSGSKTEKKRDGSFEDVIGIDVKGIKFREAAAKDGGKAVTAYGDTDFQEAFAEAYSLYLSSPSTLKALRPNVFDYLDKNLPK